MIYKLPGQSAKSETRYNHEDIVYLLHDPDQHARVVTGIMIRKTTHTYELSCGSEVSDHEEYELSPEKTIRK